MKTGELPLMDTFEQVKAKYQRRKAFSIFLMTAGCVAFALAFLFMFVLDRQELWSSVQTWAIGFGSVCVTAGAILFVSSVSALRDIERTLNKLNPDEREKSIIERAKAKTFQICLWFIYPTTFALASVLLLTVEKTWPAWIITIANFLATLITYAVVRHIEERKA